MFLHEATPPYQQKRKKIQPLLLQVPHDAVVAFCCCCRTPLPFQPADAAALPTVSIEDFALYCRATGSDPAGSAARVNRNVLQDARAHAVHSLFACRTCERVVNNARKAGFRACEHPVDAVLEYIGNACASSSANPKGPLFKHLLYNILVRVRHELSGHTHANELLGSGAAPHAACILADWAHRGHFSVEQPLQNREHAIVAAYMLSNGCAKWHVGATPGKLRRLRAFSRHMALGHALLTR